MLVGCPGVNVLTYSMLFFRINVIHWWLTHSAVQSLHAELRVVQLIKKFPAFMRPECSLSSLKSSTSLNRILSQLNIIHTFTPYFCKIDFNIVSSRLHFYEIHFLLSILINFSLGGTSWSESDICWTVVLFTWQAKYIEEYKIFI